MNLNLLLICLLVSLCLTEVLSNNQREEEIIWQQLQKSVRRELKKRSVIDTINQEDNPIQIPNSKDLLVQSVNDTPSQEKQRDIVSQLREKMETNMRLAVDTVNQLIGSTNQTLLSQYNERQRRLYEWYEKAQIDMKSELSNAHILLERLIEEAGEIIANMQTHFERLMSSTVERTYGDMIGMLSSAIGNIQTVCLEIMDKLKHSPSEANALKAVESNRPALTNVIERGLGLINQVADKLKYDMDSPINQKSADGSVSQEVQEKEMRNEKKAMEQASHKTIELAKKLLNQKRHQMEIDRKNSGESMPLKTRKHKEFPKKKKNPIIEDLE